MVEKRTPGRPKSRVTQSHKVALAASKGDTLDTLKALRDTLAESIDATVSGRDLASLSRQLTSVLAMIEAWRPAKVSTRDQLAARRKARQSAAGVVSKNVEGTDPYIVELGKTLTRGLPGEILAGRDEDAMHGADRASDLAGDGAN